MAGQLNGTRSMVVVGSLETNMKKFTSLLLISLYFFLCSCQSLIGPPPLLERRPDTINQPTNTLIGKDTNVTVSKGTYLKTDPSTQTEVILDQDIAVEVKNTDPKSSSLGNQTRTLLPKGSKVILPENTYLVTADSTDMKIEAASEVILPVGTEITITRINWYAILFYTALALWCLWYYFYFKPDQEDSIQIKTEKEKSNSSSPPSA